VKRAALLLVLLLAGLASADAPPYRGWHREGLEPLGPGEQLLEEKLPNGQRVLIRVGPNGNPQIVAVAPEPFHLDRAGGFPDEKRYRALAAGGETEKLAELLDKVLAKPESGRLLVRPPWESPVWVSARELARIRLLALDAAGKAAYRKLRDDEATPRFEAAIKTGNGDELAALLDRYPAATPAPLAAVRAGEFLLEHGSVAAARALWERARRDYADEVDVAALDSRIAAALLLEGSRTERAGSGARGVKGAPLRPIWRVRTVAPVHLPSRLPGLLALAHEDRCFVHDARGMAAFELETGRLVWRTPLERIDAPEEEGPSTASAGDGTIACVRGRRRAYLLDRGTGRVIQEVDLKRDLDGGARDRIDAAASDRGLLHVLASVSGDRVLAAYERDGTRVFRTELWPSEPLVGASPTTLSLGHEGAFVLADGGVAALDRSGDVRWARAAEALHAEPGRSCERGLVRAEPGLFVLGAAGFILLDPATGERRSVPTLPADLLLLAAGDEGPVLLNPAPPRGDPQVLAIDRRHVLIVARLDAPARPAWPGVLEQGAVWIPGDQDLVGIDLASGDEIGRARFAVGPGRLSAAGDVVVSSRDDEVVAFAPRSPLPPLAPLPDDPGEVVLRLSSPREDERLAAREWLRGAGERAKAAITAGLERPDAETREAASELLAETDLRDHWQRAIDTLKLDVSLPAFFDRDPASRLRALRHAHGADADPTRPCEPLVHVLRSLLAHDEDEAVREEALAWLVARDPEARAKVAEVLTKDEAEVPGRACAAQVLVDSEATQAGTPAHELLEAALGGRDELRRAVYDALLRHGGPREVAVVTSRAAPSTDKEGTEHKPDPMAQVARTEWAREREHAALGAGVLGPDELERRRIAREEDRHALLGQVKLGE
jgi:hypothetical protein